MEEIIIDESQLQAKTPVEFTGDEMAIGVPFFRIDTAKRTVEGYATLDNIDSTGEIVDYAASKTAFESWIGNIREMHGPSAVGKALHIEYDKELEKNGMNYKGIYVKAHISKGAEPAWQKVLDGTYTGFSVGGRVLEKRPEMVKTSDGRYSAQNIMRITKYLLTELSLVDNPANPLAKFGTINKNMLIKSTEVGIEVGDTLIEDKKLMYCEPCDVAKMIDLDSNDFECLTCDKNMTEIGKVSEAPTQEELRKMLDTLEGVSKNAAKEMAEGGYQQTRDQLGSFGLGEPGEVPPIVDVKPDLLTEKTQALLKDIAVEVDGSDLEALAKELEKTIKSYMGAKKKWKKEESSERQYGVAVDATPEGVSTSDSVPVNKVDILDVDNHTVEMEKVFADAVAKKFPIDEISVEKSMAYFNVPGKRVAEGYSLLKWSEVGRNIAKAMGDGYCFEAGKVIGPEGKALLPEDLQKNDNDDTKALNMLQKLLSLFKKRHNDAKTPEEGGEREKLSANEELATKLTDIYKTAISEMEEVLKAVGVERLNSEDSKDVTVAKDDSMAAGASAGTGPGEISTDGSGAKSELWNDSSAVPELGNVLKAEDSTETKVEKSAEETLVEAVLAKFKAELESTLASVTGDIHKSVETIGERLDKVENSGAIKKSLDSNGLTETSTAKPKSVFDGVFGLNALTKD